MRKTVCLLLLVVVMVLIPASATANEPILPLPTVTVSLPPLPPVTLPPVTVTDVVTIPGPTTVVPGPTQTATVIVTQAPQEHRIFVPGPTKTLFVPARTATVTAPVVVTRTPPSATLTKTVTQTVVVTKKVTRQPQVVPDRVQPDKDILFDLPPVSTPEAVGVGALTLLALVGLIVLGLWAGYILGYKDSDRENNNFLGALRDQFYYRGNHS